MIRKMALAHTPGLMEENMLVNGRMANNMDLESTLVKPANSDWVNGIMERELNGEMKNKNPKKIYLPLIMNFQKKRTNK